MRRELLRGLMAAAARPARPVAAGTMRLLARAE